MNRNFADAESLSEVALPSKPNAIVEATNATPFHQQHLGIRNPAEAYAPMVYEPWYLRYARSSAATPKAPTSSKHSGQVREYICQKRCANPKYGDVSNVMEECLERCEGCTDAHFEACKASVAPERIGYAKQVYSDRMHTAPALPALYRVNTQEIRDLKGNLVLPSVADKRLPKDATPALIKLPVARETANIFEGTRADYMLLREMQEHPAYFRRLHQVMQNRLAGNPASSPMDSMVLT